MPKPAGRTRKAAVAGSWYSADKDRLVADLDKMIGESKSAQVPGKVIALISPHAGYAFSGKAAAAGFKLLRGKDIRRVVVLGVAHRERFDGASIAEVTHYETPLGSIPLDAEAITRLRRCPAIKSVPSAHTQEHSIEMQLPLLQRVLGKRFTLVPLLISHLSDKDNQALATALVEVIDEQTVIVASSDFTHRGSTYRYEVPSGAGDVKARLAQVDQGSIDAIVAIDRKRLLDHKSRTGTTICGLQPIGLLLTLLNSASDVKVTVTDRYTSGDVSGNWKSTVTYIDFAFSGRWPRSALQRSRSAGASTFPLSDADRQTLLKLARAALDASVKKGAYDETVAARLTATASLKRKAGAFVTLKCKMGKGAVCVGRGHSLRGCIGTIAPLTAVYQTVARRAASAALDDRRFPNKVSVDELKFVSVEVSVLTPPKRVAGPQAIVIGRHGIILKKGGRSATFLPQVAPEQGWDRDTTLSHLARKAGIGSSGWREGAQFQVYEAIVFSEH